MTTLSEDRRSDTPLWRPDRARVEAAPLTRFAAHVADRKGLRFGDYEALWRWSVDELEAFWSEIVAFFDIRFESPARSVLSSRTQPGARWFEGATLNYAAQLLRRADAADAVMRPALIFRNESGLELTTSWRELADEVGSVADCLRRLGVVPGDRVAAFSPNIRETAVAMLASAACGAIWSSCAPDLGPTSVIDRFRQIAPKVLFAVDGYRYGGKPHDRREVVAELIAQLPSVEAVIFIDYLDPSAQTAMTGPQPRGGRAGSSGPQRLPWAEAAGSPQPPRFEPVAFEHPLWIVYSSGTTGMPKPIVHGHGGALLECMKGSALHLGITAEDRTTWFSSTSWIMWNLWISNLALGTTLVHYDGNPAWPGLGALWRLAADTGITVFGTSPAFLSQCMKAGLTPRTDHDLSALRTIGSTGSPLTQQAYHWIYREVGTDLLLASISGGTDPCAAFLTSSPTLPVYAGEMQCRALGAGVASFDEDGHAMLGQVGELVCTTPMPSMPLYFWGDDDGSRYHASYFENWPGVWRHGDWLELIERPESVTSRIYGRSDSTINRHGIRMGTSELYRIVEEFDEVIDSLAIDLEYLGKPSFLALFIVPRNRDALALSRASSTEAAARGVEPGLRGRLLEAIRARLSARHVPDEIYAIAEVPRTLTGKKLEVPVKRILLGHPVDKAVNRDAMINPQTIDWFLAFGASRDANLAALAGQSDRQPS